jgi:hypothetical protein
MSEDRDRMSGKDDTNQSDDDVEAHRLFAKDSSPEENDDSDDSDDVEAHKLA